LSSFFKAFFETEEVVIPSGERAEDETKRREARVAAGKI
jgi:hypothetical protein